MNLREKAQEFVNSKPYFNGLSEEDKRLLELEIALLLADARIDATTELRLKLFGE